MSKRKTWRMTVLAFGVLTLMAIMGGCQAFLPLEEPAADSEQTVEGLAVQGKEGVDFVCVNMAPEAKDAIPPPLDLPPGVVSVELPPLCPLGKVPQSLIRFDGPPPSRARRHISSVQAMAVTCQFGACYDWVSSRQFVTTQGMQASLTQHSPAIDSLDGFHSNGQLAADNSAMTHTVEVGWQKGTRTGGVTRLFVHVWKDNIPIGYDDCPSCGFVKTSSSVYPGMALSNNSTGILYTIQHSNGKWWVAWGSTFFGYYPDSVWNGQFTQAGVITYYGEVASSDTNGNTTTDMGNGLWASNTSAAKIFNQRYLSGSSFVNANTTKSATSTNRYTYYILSAYGMRYGGPGCTSNC